MRINPYNDDDDALPILDHLLDRSVSVVSSAVMSVVRLNFHVG